MTALSYSLTTWKIKYKTMLSIILRYFVDLDAVPDAYRESEDDHDIGKHDDYLAKNMLMEIQKEKNRCLFKES